MAKQAAVGKSPTAPVRQPEGPRCGAARVLILRLKETAWTLHEQAYTVAFHNAHR